MEPADSPSLLDDAGFLAELERMEYLQRPRRGKPSADAKPVPPAFDETTRERAHAALERALEPEYHHQQHDHPAIAAGERSRSRIPGRLVLLVLILGLFVGAGVASVMFYDRVALFVGEWVHLK